jgi:hypothetical protein
MGRKILRYLASMSLNVILGLAGFAAGFTLMWLVMR